MQLMMMVVELLYTGCLVCTMLLWHLVTNDDVLHNHLLGTGLEQIFRGNILDFNSESKGCYCCQSN